MLKIDYNSKNHLTTVTDHNSVIDPPRINLCITDGENQNLSPSTKHPLEWNFLFGNCNLCDTQIILWSPTFGTDKFLSSSCIPFEQRPKCEVYHYTKEKCKALHGNKS